jgi:hypothetical protein
MTRFAIFLLLAATPALSCRAQPADKLAGYFGFAETRVVVLDEDAGPVIAADFNADGLPDLAVANNRKSRIEIFYLRSDPRTPEQLDREYKVNELPPNPWYDGVKISVGHSVQALAAHDADADGDLDLVYAGSNPSELVILRQDSFDAFEVLVRRRVRDLAANKDGLAIADVLGGSAPELIAAVGGRIHAFPLSGAGEIGEPVEIGAGGELVAMFVEDYDGDGFSDIVGVAPNSPAPLRLWLQAVSGRGEQKRGRLGAELRFEMPALVEAEPVRFPGRPAASIAVIERASRRIVFYDLAQPDSAARVAGEREVQPEVGAFRGGTSRDRSVAVGDIDGDGLPELLATDAGANAIVVHRHRPGEGLDAGASFGTFKKPKHVDVGPWEGGAQRVFVLSEEEKTVGISAYEEGRLGFAQPLGVATAGATPLAIKHVALEQGPALAVVVSQGRSYTLELHRPGDATPATIELTGARREPGSILATDADRDGATDLLVLTPGEEMFMVRGGEKDGAYSLEQVLTKSEMAQFGLVQAAGPANTALLDVTGDGAPELLIADANFVRACEYDSASGWRVVEQVNLPDAPTEFVALALLERSGEMLAVAADRAGGRLVVFGPSADGPWEVRERMRLAGFGLTRLFAGPFAGDEEPAVLAISDEAYGLVRPGGQRAVLDQFAAHRPESEDRFEHEIEAGDVNGDGYTDLVVLDANERMCEIYTFSASRRLHPATEFEVFQTRRFSGGQSRESEPSAATVAELTGDGASDLLLLAHDRLLIYPQQTAGVVPEASGRPGPEE